MSLGGHRDGSESKLLIAVVKAFCTCALIYPAPYFVGLIGALIFYFAKCYRVAMVSASIGPAFLLVVGLLFGAWFAMGI